MDDSDPGPVVVDEIRLRAILKKIIDDELKPTFLKMLEKSESRIDRTNRMVNKLANACHAVEDAYTSHIGSLQPSRDKQQEENVELIRKNKDLTKMLETCMKERDRLLAILEKEKEEKQALRQELHKATDEYAGIFKSYVRLSEMANASSGASSDVKINL